MIARRTAAAAIALVACTVAPAQTTVTALLPNTVSLETPPHDRTPPDPVFAEAVDAALARRGFTTLQQPGHARLIAAFSVKRTEVGTTSSKVAVAGPAMQPGGATGVGASFSIALPTATTRIVPLVRTQVDMQLIARTDNQTMWRGSAVTVRAADTDAAIVASALVNAVLDAPGGNDAGIIAVP